MANFELLSESVIAGKIQQVKETTQNMLDEGANPLDIINKGLISGMNVVGARMKASEMFIPEVLIAAKAMSAGIELVKPLIGEGDMPNNGTVIIGTVQGDLHDIGKNLVAMMLESSGFNVIDLGIDISPGKFIAAVEEHSPDVVAMSSLLTTTMLAMKETVAKIKDVNSDVSCVVGGAPVTQSFADEIGADGYASNASGAIDLCSGFLGS